MPGGVPRRIAEGERIYLQELSLPDASYLAAAFQAETEGDGLRLHDVDLRHLEAYVEQAYAYYGYGLWGVYLRGDDQEAHPIGICGVDLVHLPEIGTCHELGYALLPQFRGHGYMAEALRLVIAEAFRRDGDVGAEKIIARIAPDNHRSIRTAIRAGLVQCGTTSRKSHKNGLVNEEMYAIINGNENHMHDS